MYGMNGYQDVDSSFVAQAAEQGALLVDVRGDMEVAQGTIPGAVHIPMHLIPLRAGELPKDKPVVLFCRSGARSGQVCAFLAQQGHRNLHNLAGGIMAWARAGLPIGLLQQHAAA